MSETLRLSQCTMDDDADNECIAEYDDDDEAYASLVEHRRAFEEIVSILSALPGQDTITAKLGEASGHRFLTLLEAIEAHSNTLGEYGGSHSGSEGAFAFVDFDPSCGTTLECRDALAILEIVAANIGDDATIVDEYDRFRARQRRELIAQRQHIAQVNQPIRERAQRLNMWFPIKSAAERERWQRIGGAGYELYALAEAVKLAMKQREPGMVQYVAKKRISSATVPLLEGNIASMRAFLLNTRPC